YIGVVSNYATFTGSLWKTDIYSAIPASIKSISSGSGDWDSHIDLVCMVKGLPEPNISWYYGSTRLENGDKYTILSVNSGTSLYFEERLAIKNSGVADTNQTYYCEAMNFLNPVPARSEETMISINNVAITLI
ncbi:immunoglobulin domain-containing protein, partial [Salmonella sp. s51228]|uniref:immunoglobulin domain-containing protein n=1 Tax=Salmonella sp. s51228 TaxID=3159652 RepID=UPI0039802D9C